MECLEINQICDWAERHGLVRGEGFFVQLPILPLTHHAMYAHGSRSGQELVAAKELSAHLGGWDECLVWIRAWGIWPSGEDWPQFYAWRGALGERRSVETAPGHRFEPSDVSTLVQLLGIVMGNAWDVDILCSVGGVANKVRAHISHDEWFEVLALPSVAISAG